MHSMSLYRCKRTNPYMYVDPPWEVWLRIKRSWSHDKYGRLAYLCYRKYCEFESLLQHNGSKLYKIYMRKEAKSVLKIWICTFSTSKHIKQSIYKSC